MTLKEAIATGKKIKRSEWATYYNPEGYSFGISVGDAIADDWQVEQSPVTITSEQFWNAASDSMKEYEMDSAASIYFKPQYGTSRILKLLAEKLGL
jgi:hypothetical protein